MGKCESDNETAEQKFCRLAKRKGWTPIRAGWPDFIIRDRKGRLVFVEVKALDDSLRDSQLVTFEALEQAGIQVKVWWDGNPGKLMSWRSFQRRARAMASAVRRARKEQRQASMMTDEETEKALRLSHFDA